MVDAMEDDTFRVLIVDDNLGAMTAASKYLELSGFAVRSAADGASALAHAGWPPDVVVLDLGLPDMDGFEVLERLKRTLDPRSVRFFALSGRSDDATRARCLEAGFSDLLVKPVSLERLAGLLGELKP